MAGSTRSCEGAGSSREGGGPGGRVLRLALAALLALSLAPLVTPGSARADEGADAGGGADEVAQQLAVGAYAQGEAVVIVDNTAAGYGLRSRSVDVLASAEPLMDASGETYASATGESLPLEEPAENGATVLRSRAALPEEDAVTVSLVRQEGASTEDLLRQLADDPRVLAAEPNYLFSVDPGEDADEARLAAVQEALGMDAAVDADGSNGPGAPAAANGAGADVLDLTAYQWGCDSSGDTLVDESVTRPDDFDINPPSWNVEGAQNASGVVAVVDTGVDVGHPDLKNIMCDMTQYTTLGGEHGFNAFAALTGGDETDLTDNYHHGTHCAGIIAAEWNGFGTSGVASGVQLVAVKADNEERSLPLSAILLGYGYLANAVEGGLDLKVISNSWGGADNAISFSLAVTKLGEKGVVSVMGSGNESADLDKNPSMAGALAHNPYVVTVNASDIAGRVASFSNFGLTSTDVFAPGVNILSPVPVGTGAYLPEADAGRLSFDTFDGKGEGVQLLGMDARGEEVTEPVPGQAVQDATRYDAAGGALTVKSTDLNGPIPGISFAAVSIPVSEENFPKVRYIGLKCLGWPHEGVMVTVSVKANTARGVDWVALKGPTQSENGWGTVSIDTQALLKEGEQLAYEDGRLLVQLMILAEDPIDFAIDAVGVGADGASTGYAYNSGTSMATPMVTGAALVLAGDASLEGMAPAERAAGLAALVKGTVRPMKEFEGLCSSGGHVDLSVAQQPAMRTPVVSNARVEADGDQVRIVVEGSFFGADKGSVRVGGLSATVETWSDSSIAVTCPKDARSGVLAVEVTTANGRAGTKGFLLDVPHSPAGSTPVFEKTIPLPTLEEGFSANVDVLLPIGLGGSLYVLPVFSEKYRPFTQLWRYDEGGASWTQCADLPVTPNNNVSVTTYDGNLFLYGETGADAEARPLLLSYDPAADAWQEHDASGLPLDTTIANCDGTLLFVGAAEFKNGKWRNVTADNIVSYDPETGAVQVAGTLAVPCATPQVAVRGSELLVAGGTQYTSSGKASILQKIERVTKQGGAYAGKEITDALPALAPGYAFSPSLASAKKGFVLTGITGMADAKRADAVLDEDTFLLDLEGGGTSFQGLGTRASAAPLYNPRATAYDGWLYVAGSSNQEEGGFVLRATPMETLPQAGDVPEPGPEPEPEPGPEPGPDPQPEPEPETTPAADGGSPAALVRTGDPLAPAAVLLACALAAGALAMAAHRKRE
ncbi:S8 family serine peptidase [Arabiibacter massiliensis]|uniref:S8 family serine peptidase n=1 Tax=Arabiibacter massiliensis TaxID=1870985 RepID=UPI0009BB1FE0|nr:S8 family serine peptidase [Arabiibacter massiliensis]